MNFVTVAALRMVSWRCLLGLGLVLVSTGVSACQNTSLGEQLQGAVAPKVTPTPTPEPINTIDPRPTPPSAETKTPTEKNPQQITDSPTNSLKPAVISWLNIAEKTAAKSLQQSKFSPAPLLSSRSFIPEDIEQAPIALQGYIRDLTQLGVINPRPGQTENTYSLSPNSPVARREYVRWLVTTNNRFYSNQPSRQVRLAQLTEQPFFSDVPANDPDFAVIQGLANAGLLAINAENDAPNLFRPDDPVTRQEMVGWKIPFDIRQPLPVANLEAVQKAWGFRDVKDLNNNYFDGFVADAQLGEQSNVRRSFGFTVLLQPNKNITRAEAIAALWYFGTATDGLSARRVQQLEQAANSNDKSNNSKGQTSTNNESKSDAKSDPTARP